MATIVSGELSFTVEHLPFTVKQAMVQNHKVAAEPLAFIKTAFTALVCCCADTWLCSIFSR